MKRIVGFSGGADSQAVADWCLQEFDPKDVILVNSDAGGNEHPLTTEHVRWYSENVHPVVMLSAQVQDMAGHNPKAIRELGLSPTDPLTFDLLAKLKGRFPSRKAQFCTEHLKLQPLLRWQEENALELLREGFERYVGVRADESQSRAKLPETQWDDLFDCQLHRPLLQWTKLQVFDFIRQHSGRVCPLYTLGFDRVGCAPCINSKKMDVRMWAARFPEMIAKVREWEARVGRTFFAPCVPGKEINWIDEVVAWSKTEWGGKQLSLPIVEAEAEAGVCVSRYGLCD